MTPDRPHRRADDDLLPVLAERVHALTEQIVELVNRFDRYVLVEVYRVEQTALDRRVSELEKALGWVIRAIVGAVIVAMLAAAGLGASR